MDTGLSNTFEEQVRWLMRHLGPEEDTMSGYTVESLMEGGGYAMTSMSAENETALITEVIRTNAHLGEVGRIFIQPIVVNKVCSCKLINQERLR